MALQVIDHKRISLREQPGFTEKWLLDRIAESPIILGLGDVEILVVEKKQSSGGRLDLLLHNEQLERRYEVELMLGATDASHIIRTIEYWDLERRRYPAYEHVAVIVAEDVTTRFLNVMSLFAGSIPLIAIQLSALEVEGKVLLHFVRVLDQTRLRTDDAYEATASGSNTPDTDRTYWQSNVGTQILELCDRVLGIANEVSATPLELKYKKRHIGLCVGGSFFNIGALVPQKQEVQVRFPTTSFDNVENWAERLTADGFTVAVKSNWIGVYVRPSDLEQKAKSIIDFVHAGIRGYQAE